MFRNILVAIDPDDRRAAPAQLRLGVGLARRHGSRLRIAAVIRDLDALVQLGAVPAGYELAAKEAENRLAATVRELDCLDLRPQLIVTHGPAIYVEILRIAAVTEADLVVVGAHRPEIKDYLLGSNAERVVRHARCSVLVARD